MRNYSNVFSSKISECKDNNAHALSFQAINYQLI